jgi:hypothetical protein
MRAHPAFPDPRLYAREHGQNANQTPLDYKRVASKGYHTLSFRPVGVANAFVIHDIVCKVRLSLLRDETNLQLPDRHAGMFSVKPGVLTCACLQLQHVLRTVECPNAGERRVEVVHDGLCAALEHILQGTLCPA